MHAPHRSIRLRWSHKSTYNGFQNNKTNNKNIIKNQIKINKNIQTIYQKQFNNTFMSGTPRNSIFGAF